MVIVKNKRTGIEWSLNDAEMIQRCIADEALYEIVNKDTDATKEEEKKPVAKKKKARAEAKDAESKNKQQ